MPPRPPGVYFFTTHHVPLPPLKVHLALLRHELLDKKELLYILGTVVKCIIYD